MLWVPTWPQMQVRSGPVETCSQPNSCWPNSRAVTNCVSDGADERFRVELVEDIGVNAFLARGQVAEQRHQPADPRRATDEQRRVHVMAERLLVGVQESLAEVAVEREQDAARSPASTL